MGKKEHGKKAVQNTIFKINLSN